jgi:hypothetical protein
VSGDTKADLTIGLFSRLFLFIALFLRRLFIHHAPRQLTAVAASEFAVSLPHPSRCMFHMLRGRRTRNLHITRGDRAHNL